MTTGEGERFLAVFFIPEIDPAFCDSSPLSILSDFRFFVLSLAEATG